jgi:radical SAM superfamily enzyme YgiQ (UPF0313 family)
LLINPGFKYKHYGAQDELSHLMGKKKMSIPLALPLLAAMTPEHYDIKIVDDETEPLPTEPVPDLVGITTLVSTINRAYEIADFYRSKGAAVVMGGTYATFMPTEVLEHADSVLIGEAEGQWRGLLRDFEDGLLKPEYTNPEPPAFKTSVVPRWDLVKVKDVMTLGVQTTRGCPYNCEFCLVNKMFGRRVRFRDVDDVIKEIVSLPIKKLFFVDDNLTINKRYAKELMAKLKPLKISWVCQSSIDVAKDDELLKEMVDAGCLSILIGFESLNPDSLKETNKRHNKIETYEAAIKKIHSFGINVLASFVVGFDADTVESFDHIRAFADKTDIVYTMLSVLSAAPGTDLWQRMEREGRLYGVQRDYINGAFPCMHYNRISQSQLLDTYFASLREMYSYESLLPRARRLFGSGAFRHSGGAEEVGFFDKVTTSMKIIRRFGFSSNKAKRAIFKELFAMVRNKTASAESIVIFLLSMEAVSDYLGNADAFLDEVRLNVAAVDKGPWRSAVH